MPFLLAFSTIRTFRRRFVALFLVLSIMSTIVHAEQESTYWPQHEYLLYGNDVLQDLDKFSKFHVFFHYWE